MSRRRSTTYTHTHTLSLHYHISERDLKRLDIPGECVCSNECAEDERGKTLRIASGAAVAFAPQVTVRKKRERVMMTKTAKTKRPKRASLPRKRKVRVREYSQLITEREQHLITTTRTDDSTV